MTTHVAAQQPRTHATSPARRALPPLPFELQEAILVEAGAFTPAPFHDDDVAPLVERRTFLARACRVSRSWKSVAEPLLNFGPTHLDVDAYTIEAPRTDPRVAPGPDTFWQPRLLQCLCAIAVARERFYRINPRLPGSRPVVVPVDLSFKVTAEHHVVPHPYSSAPLQTRGEWFVSTSDLHQALEQHARRSDPLGASRVEGYGVAVRSLALECEPNMDLARIERFVGQLSLRSLEQLSLSGHAGLEKILYLLCNPSPAPPHPVQHFVPGGLDGPERLGLTELRIQGCDLDLEILESVHEAVLRGGRQLRVLHLLPAQHAWIPRQLLNGLDGLEVLALNTRSCAFLFDGGRLPALKHLYLGSPARVNDLDLAQPASRLVFKTMVDEVVAQIPRSRVGLRVGLSQLSFKGTHRRAALVRNAAKAMRKRGLVLTDRWGQDFAREWERVEKRAKVAVQRRSSTFGSGWVERRGQRKVKKGRREARKSAE